MRNLHLTLLALIFILGILVRLYGIDNPVADWHSFRQADTVSVAKLYSLDGINLLVPKYHDISTIQSGIFNPNGYRFVEFPIYNAIIASLYTTFPRINIDVWSRIVSIYLSLVSAFLVYFLGLRFISKLGGLLSASFFLLLPFNVYFTRVILPEPMATMLGLLGVSLFVHSFDNQNNLTKYLSAVVFTLAILVKPFTIFYLTPVAYLVISKNLPLTRKKMLELFRRYILFTIIIIVPFLLWRVWENKFPEGIPFLKWIFNGDGIRFKPSFWRWIFGERLGLLILGIWGLIPFAYGLIKKTSNYFIHFFLFGMFIYVSVIATANVRHDYYQTLTIPAISLVLASGSVYLLRKKTASRILLLFSIFMMMMVSLVKVREYYKIDHPEIIYAGVVADKLLPKDAKIIAPYNGDTAFLYQTKRIGWPYVDRPIDEMIEKGASYYISVNLDTQTNGFMEKFETIKRTDKYVILDLKSKK